MNRNDTLLMVDAHVHYHSCFDPEEFLDHATRNFQHAVGQLGEAEEWIGCLLLADRNGQDSPRVFLDAHRRSSLKAWAIRETEEPGGLVACRASQETLVIAPGFQAVSSEGIEVLALATKTRLPDGLPLVDLMRLASESDAITVLPWGFGKWWFGRGQTLRGTFHSKVLPARGNGHPVYLGDNHMRPDAFRPGLFRLAEENSVAILPGSDPLPVLRHSTRAGRFGFMLRGDIDIEHPASSIKGMLGRVPGQPRTFGHRQSLTGFVRDQLAARRPPATTPATTPETTPENCPMSGNEW